MLKVIAPYTTTTELETSVLAATCTNN